MSLADHVFKGLRPILAIEGLITHLL
jgi:hypothetical protein